MTLDPNGDTLYWQRITSGDSAIYYIGRQALVKNGPAYYLAGTYEDYNNGVRDACRLKMNYQGARIWEKEFGGAKTDILDCLQRTRMAI